MEKFSLDNILKLIRLENELELEKAIALHGKLRWMSKEDDSLVPVRQHLKKLIKAYEENHWKIEKSVTSDQVAKSEFAENYISKENRFVQKRKELIKRKLKKLGLQQQNLADLLGHRKNYMSELINGLRPLSKNDIVIIHKLLHIKLQDLMLPVIDEKIIERISQKVEGFNNPKIKFNREDMSLEAV